MFYDLIPIFGESLVLSVSCCLELFRAEIFHIPLPCGTFLSLFFPFVSIFIFTLFSPILFLFLETKIAVIPRLRNRMIRLGIYKIISTSSAES